LEEFGLLDRLSRSGVRILPSQGYIENLGLMSKARFVLTDSGGIQEETSYLSVPCLTLRENTERPVTVSHGTNTLVGSDFAKARGLVCDILSQNYKKSRPVRGWDGRAAKRVVEALAGFLEARRNNVPANLQAVG
jgi:UDP-N-acetylglucosamine 2-epimerase (non-hydrolysing)